MSTVVRPERALWALYEPVHAITYFDPATFGCLAEAGLHGFWNGYFAGRAAPLGPTGPAPVTALFFGFAPAMVAKALPKVWSRITPERALELRFAATSRTLTPYLEQGGAEDVRRVTDALVATATDAVVDGRALAAAWQGVPVPEDQAARLWWAASVLREHRGDGHVIAATHAELSGLEAGITHCALGTITREALQPSRGWTDEEWDVATEGLVARGLVTAGHAALTPAGQTLREQVEAHTDRLAAAPAAVLAEDLAVIRPVLTAVARAIQAAGSLPAVNPMGLPLPD
ncbi:MAG TPA: hypothetical protein VFE15_10860 [Marmoricola sp.]|jgi:hypothetical protein|nr:hypothetical protein [Marmoricola sp.]